MALREWRRNPLDLVIDVMESIPAGWITSMALTIQVTYVEVEGELRYREFTPTESDRSVRVAEIYAASILLLDRSDRQPASEAADSESVEEPTR